LWKRGLLGGVAGAIAGTLWHLFSRRQLVATYHLPLMVASDLLDVAVIAGVPGGIPSCYFPLRAWVAGAPSNNRSRGPRRARGFAPRARGDRVRPRLQSGGIGRPLSVTVRQTAEPALSRGT